MSEPEPAAEPSEILGALPRTRPQRRSARRPARPAQPPRRHSTPRPATPQHPGLLGTAVLAAAELAEIGLRASARALSQTVSRLPRP